MANGFKVVFYTLAVCAAFFFDLPFICVGIVIGEVLIELMEES